MQFYKGSHFAVSAHILLHTFNAAIVFHGFKTIIHQGIIYHDKTSYNAIVNINKREN